MLHNLKNIINEQYQYYKNILDLTIENNKVMRFLAARPDYPVMSVNDLIERRIDKEDRSLVINLQNYYELEDRKKEFLETIFEDIKESVPNYIKIFDDRAEKSLYALNPTRGLTAMISIIAYITGSLSTFIISLGIFSIATLVTKSTKQYVNRIKTAENIYRLEQDRLEYILNNNKKKYLEIIKSTTNG